MSKRIANIDDVINRYLTAPETNAAGRLGLFRIIFSLFYLWVISSYSPAYLYHLPEHLLDETLAVRYLPNHLPIEFYQILFFVLVASLVMLMFGCFTLVATVMVVAFGWMVESHYISSGFEHGSIFLLGFIPFFMMICGDWGSTWSIDALRQSQRGEVIDPADTSPRFVMPIHGSLVVLAALFCSAGIYKLIPWTVGENVFGYHLLDTNIKLAKLGHPVNPTASWFLHVPLLDYSMRAFVVLFELTFPLALLGRRIRSVYLFTGLMFNAVNGAFLGVTFTPLLIVYLLFVDWHGLLRRVLPEGKRVVPAKVPLRVVTLGITCTALAAGGIWVTSRLLHNVLTLNGSITNRTLWYPIVPIAISGFAWSVMKLASVAFRRLRGMGDSTPQAA